MSSSIKIILTVGGIYEIRGKQGAAVRFKFVHANSGNPTIEVNGIQKEVDSVLNLVSPQEFDSLVAIDAPTHF